MGRKSYFSQYSYKVRFSEEDGCWIASVDEFPSVMAHGETEEEAHREIRKVVSHVIVDMHVRGESPPLPPRRSNNGGRGLFLSPMAFAGAYETLRDAIKSGPFKTTFVGETDEPRSLQTKTPIPLLGPITNIALDVALTVGMVTFMLLDGLWYFLGLEEPRSSLSRAAFELGKVIFAGAASSPFLLLALPGYAIQKAWLSYGIKSGRYIELETVFKKSGVGISDFVEVVHKHVEPVNRDFPVGIVERDPKFRNHESYLLGLIKEAYVKSSDISKIEDMLANKRRM